jgi:hypothetical protein
VDLLWCKLIWKSKWHKDDRSELIKMCGLRYYVSWKVVIIVLKNLAMVKKPKRGLAPWNSLSWRDKYL